MRALTLRSGLEYCEQYPTPSPAGGEAVVRVIQAGICATDLQLVQGYMGFQGVPGHEFVGIVEEAPHHPDLVGKRVVGEINAACRVCPVCQAGRSTHCPHRTTLGIDRRDGAFADFLALPVENLYPLPDEITNDQAVFTEPLAAALSNSRGRYLSTLRTKSSSSAMENWGCYARKSCIAPDAAWRYWDVIRKNCRSLLTAASIRVRIPHRFHPDSTSWSRPPAQPGDSNWPVNTSVPEEPSCSNQPTTGKPPWT